MMGRKSVDMLALVPETEVSIDRALLRTMAVPSASSQVASTRPTLKVVPDDGATGTIEAANPLSRFGVPARRRCIS